MSFWQTPIREQDRDKTAFLTRKGQWRYKVLPYGLVNAPSLFQRLMNLVLAGLTWKTCLCYVDDVILMATSFQQMVGRLEEVLGRFRRANLKLKPTKCRLFQEKINFLGHVVSGSGIEADPDKVRAVLQWPVPRNVTDVRAFVALAGYYRKFQKDFSANAAPLHELTRKGEKFVWDSRRQEAFDKLKESLTSAPILSLPRDQGDWQVDVDSSSWATGGVLQQYQDGEFRVIAYSSRLLTKVERSYCTTRRELLAILHALKLWKTYLLGRHVILRTDHFALLFLRKTPEPSGQQARWLNFFEMFDLELQHRRGASHSNADALSRRPCEQDAPCRQCRGSKNQTGLPAWEPAGDTRLQAVMTRAAGRRQQRQDDDGGNTRSGDGSPTRANQPDQRPHDVAQQTEFDAQPTQVGGETVAPRSTARDSAPAAADATLPSWTKDELAAAQTADVNIAPIRDWLISGDSKPDRKAMTRYSDETRAYWAQWDSLELREGVVHRKFVDRSGQVDFHQLLVPGSLRTQLIRVLHEKSDGHLGVEKKPNFMFNAEVIGLIGAGM